MVLEGSKRRYFPFKQGYLSVATLRIGSEFQMTVDGKHITSFAYREVCPSHSFLWYFYNFTGQEVSFFEFIFFLGSLSIQTLEPWLVSDVRISGDLNLISVVASGLPTSEDSEHTIDLEALKSAPLSPRKPPHLFIGVFSTANNFKRRMAVRRTWMQYAAVRSGTVAVRFFVGLVSFSKYSLLFFVQQLLWWSCFLAHLKERKVLPIEIVSWLNHSLIDLAMKCIIL